MRRIPWRAVTIWLAMATAMVTACGGAQTPEPEGPGAGGGSAEPATPETVPEPSWDQLSHEQRAGIMRDVVLPGMKQMFQEFDAERYATFDCGSCHGENARDVGFRMPNGVAPIDPASIPASFQSQEPMDRFMTQRVWPRMAEMLREPPYNPETHQGFGCMECHATATASTTPSPTAH